MPEQAILDFHEKISESEEMQQQIRAITTYQELIKFGEKYGYSFTKEDIRNASNAIKENEKTASVIQDVHNSSKISQQKYHYEFKCLDIPKLAKIAPEFDKLKIKPSTVDIKHFDSYFIKDDFNFISLSPSVQEFNSRHNEIVMSESNSAVLEPYPEYTKRSFHLINLDLHVDHSVYEQYFLTKLKIIKYLENLFETEIRFSGSLWYPPNSYRLWHTNETQPGWRMYWIDYDGFERNTHDRPFFRYMNPETKELVTLEEQPKIVRFFKVENDANKLFWHCIANPTKFNRWSFGFVVSDNWMDKLFSG